MNKESILEQNITVVNPKFVRAETALNPMFSRDSLGHFISVENTSRDDVILNLSLDTTGQSGNQSDHTRKDKIVDDDFSHEIYEMLAPLSVKSGEGKLYLCQSQGEKYVCKLYKGQEIHDKPFYDVLKQLNSPHIAKLITYGVYQGFFYEIYPYYPKGDIAGITFSLKEICENILPSITQGLQDLHQIGICHGDVKPSNVMFQNHGNGYLLLDFGVSFLLESGNPALGKTENYAAPEVSFHQSGACELSDYYALGICLYELYFGEGIHLTGQEAKSFQETSILPLPEKIPRAFRFLLQGLLFADIKDRDSVKQAHPLDISSYSVTYRWGFEELTLWMAYFCVESRYEIMEITEKQGEVLASSPIEVLEPMEKVEEDVGNPPENVLDSTIDVLETAELIAEVIKPIEFNDEDHEARTLHENTVDSTEEKLSEQETQEKDIVSTINNSLHDSEISKLNQVELTPEKVTDGDDLVANDESDGKQHDIPTFLFLGKEFRQMSSLVKEMAKHWWDGREVFFSWELLTLLKAHNSPYTPILEESESAYYDGKSENFIFWSSIYQLDKTFTDIVWEEWSAPNLLDLGVQLEKALLDEKEQEGKGYACCYALLRHGIISEYLSLPQCGGQKESFRKLEILYRVCEKDSEKRGTFPRKLVDELLKYER